MFATTGGMLTLTILKGGGDINPLNLDCSAPLYWVLTIAALPWVLDSFRKSNAFLRF